MKFEEALEQVVNQGAIRVFRLSDSLAYVYRMQGSSCQARGIYGAEGNWQLGERLVSAKDYDSKDGWYDVPALPWQTKTINLQAAKKNPGYGLAILQQCHTCKEQKPILAFERGGFGVVQRRNWECNKCYKRRIREMASYRKSSSIRQGDFLDKATIASPPPPKSEI